MKERCNRLKSTAPLLCALLLGALLLSGCSWMKFWEGDEEKEGSEIEPAELVDFDAEIRIKKLWSTGIGGGQNKFLARLHPVLGDGMIYGADSEGRVMAVDVATGKRRWRQELDVVLTGGLGYGSGLVLVGSVEGEVYALNAEDGALRWHKPVGSEVLSAPGANGDVVVVQTQNGKLIALDTGSGDEIWQYSVDVPVLTLRGTAEPLITNNLVVTGFSNGKVVALEPATGSLLWENRIAIAKGRSELERMVDVDGTPLLVGDLIYATSYQGRASAMSRGTGRSLWYQDSSSALPPAQGQGQVYITETGDVVKALRANSGQVTWSNDQLSFRKLTGPTVVDSYVAVADIEGYLHVLSQTDGHFVGRTKVDGSGISVPMVSEGGVLYVQDNDGGLTAYRFESR